jgi:hypothetical protein
VDEIKTGMAVKSVEDRSLGLVTGVHGCCFEFQLRTSGQRASVDPSGVFHSHMNAVTLICTEHEVRRYECATHPGYVAAPTAPLRSGQVFGRPERVFGEHPGRA